DGVLRGAQAPVAAAQPGAAVAGRDRGRRAPSGVHLFERHAPAARDRTGPDRRAEAAAVRRADQRAGSGFPARRVQYHRHAARQRRHGAGVYPRPGRGRAPGRPGRGDASRHAAGGGHAGRTARRRGAGCRAAVARARLRNDAAAGDAAPGQWLHRARRRRPRVVRAGGGEDGRAARAGGDGRRGRGCRDPRGGARGPLPAPGRAGRGRGMNVLKLAAQEIRVGLRNRWVMATTVLLAALSLSLVLLGSAPTGVVKADPLAVVVVSLASLTIFLVPLIALLLSFDAIVGEHE